jgi:hypothetical protein
LVCSILLVGHSSKIRENFVFALLVFVHFAFTPFPSIEGQKRNQNNNKMGKSKTKFHHFHSIFVPKSARAKSKCQLAKAKWANISVAKTISPLKINS